MPTWGLLSANQTAPEILTIPAVWLHPVSAYVSGSYLGKNRIVTI
jgi:hypothetical protein